MSMENISDDLKQKSYIWPFAIFMAFMVAMQLAEPLIGWNHPSASWWRRAPEQWIYPLQTLTCLACLIIWRKGVSWDWKWKPALIGCVFGIIGISLWLLPTIMADRIPGELREYFGNPAFEWYKYILGIDHRTEGFNPSDAFADHSPMWYAALALRFLRAVVVVAFVEELFWRGFLMRFLINDDQPWSVPFGTHSWKAYWITTIAFMLVHQPVDYMGAYFYGSLTYLLAVATKNLGATIIMHAIANLCLGYAAMSWGKYGLW